ncbi:nitroreductase family deazaflavin-dependent oxidoreductase [Novosphingobium sp. JCM 18896]|uniref:nitroreductase family deazaflavin-dependent oxidoreductase n=1 Tax=Novosphingobium sp. JCM 18896 TaxID=2989731 RepID=UPI002222EAEF|nr:nitroreductase family deazaflavin-dependent oxidoreductase [Novosphingobium sp. JCM 18896]MCW1428794.1 nitroreductase family deazaflavin-dependent oxidoreductase [Novosphingobium sp. JCM 18896]
MALGNPPRSPAEMDFTIAGPSHVEAYRATGGETGYIWNNATTLLLTTKGRKSGEDKTVPLIFVGDGPNYVIIASLGGAPKHPVWYLNLEAEPLVTLQVKDKVFQARAHTAPSPERERLWAKAVEAWPQYDDYQAKTDREIPVVVLEPVAA